MSRSSGFTLVELVIVLVILGILAAVAVPQFGSTTDTATDTAVQTQAGNISSANAINMAECRLNGSSGDCTTIASGDVCSDSGVSSLMDDFDTNSFTASDSGGSSCGADEENFEMTPTGDGSGNVSIGSSSTCCLASN